jgi:hypothetical protein
LCLLECLCGFYSEISKVHMFCFVLLSFSYSEGLKAPLEKPPGELVCRIHGSADLIKCQEHDYIKFK